jgi:hypothetical protein
LTATRNACAIIPVMNKENSTFILSVAEEPVPSNPLDAGAVPPYVQPATRDSGLATGGASRRVGGQPGNHNARVHGFYSRRASPEQAEEAAEAREVKGLDEEIELLRRKIRFIEETKPDDAVLIAGLIRTLSLVMSRRRFAGSGPLPAITETAKKMLQNVIMPAGILKDALDKMGVFRD